MKRTVLLNCVALFCAAPFLTVPVPAQTVTGTLTGTITDSSGAVVTNASVTLINENTNDQRTTLSGPDGSFVLTGVFPGRYTVRVEAQGFKRYDSRGVNITAAERLGLGQIALDVGATTESITVAAQGASVQTQSPERSAMLTSDQLNQLASQGRTVLGLLRTVPGIPNPGDGGGLPNVNGLPSSMVSMSTDGTPNTELGTAFSSTRPQFDAVAEVKVLTSNYQAEYGITAGAIVQIVTKSGSNAFHGSAYYYGQHEQYNANSFFNNRNGVVKPVSRTWMVGGSIGGPVYIPKIWNTNRTKLFFFWNQEERRQPFQSGLTQNTVPTELERAGDFSQTLDVGNRLVPIRDPLNNLAQFPGNVIPSARINPTSQKLFQVFPNPNFFDRAISGGNYNYLNQHPGRNIRRQWVNRFDYNISPKIRLYVRGIRELNREFDWLYQQTAPEIFGLNHIPKTDGGINSTQVLSESLVNEVLFGVHHRTEYRSVAPPGDRFARDSAAALSGYTRSALGVSLPTLYNNNAYNVIPALSFSGDVPSALNLSWSAGGYFPPTTSEISQTFTDNLSKILGKQTLKAGVTIQHLLRMSTGSGSAAGAFAFGRNVNNPNDSNYSYANALLGNFTTYQESTSVPLTRSKSTIVEWFVQDNWRATKKLTLDFGIRFSWFTPFYQANGNASNFMPSLWTRSNSPTLYVPALNASNQRVAKNPLTGTLAPVTLIGALVAGSGEPANGMAVQSDKTFPNGFLDRQGVLFAPRFGVAYDVFGDGKTALRFGGGIFHQTWQTNVETVFVQNPPIQYTPTIYFGSMTDYFNTQGVLFPSTGRGFALPGQAPTVYNYNFGIQRDIGFNTILDVAYVGNLSRHNNQTRNINALPTGTRFLAAAQDPTRPNTPLPDDFLRPYPGYGAINVGDRTGNSNYNSLQVQANRRFSKGIQFGASYTWSKTMAYDGSPSIFLDARLNNYGRTNFDFTHIAVINWVWDVPRASTLWSNAVTKSILDNWRLSGIATFQTGPPLNISFTTSDGADLTGGGDPIRIDVIKSPHLSKGERSFTRWFDSTAFARPARLSVGTLGRGLLSGPGFNNFDLTLQKDFRWRERLSFRLQFEAYNAFNHTQFNAINATARFDPAGVQTNSQLGQVTSARAARTGQVSLRMTF